MGLHELFLKLNFKDIYGTKEDVKVGNFFEQGHKQGEFVDPKGNLNRRGDMYEYYFVTTKAKDVTEYEIKWRARKKAEHSKYGWIEFKFDLTIRNCKDIEILEGNSKKTLQSGSWEFRNDMTYKNSVEMNYINKIPIVKNYDYLKKIVFGVFFEKTLENDVEYFHHKTLHKIQDYIKSSFVN